MVNTTASLTNVNLLSKEQYDAIESPATDELWAVETPVVVETYKNGTSWYRVYSDGWCEQGGYVSFVSGMTINLLKSFANTNYHVQLTLSKDVAINNPTIVKIAGKTSSAFIATYASTDAFLFWEAKGYIN